VIPTVIRVAPAPPAARRPSARRIVAATLAVVSLVLAVPVYRHGVIPGRFPSWVAGAADYTVERYSGPWVTGAFGLVLLAVVALAVALTSSRSLPAVPAVTPPAGAFSWPVGANEYPGSRPTTAGGTDFVG
jgi:hypothetical protein